MAKSTAIGVTGHPASAPRLWVGEGLAAGATLELPAPAMRHVAALRLRDGDMVTLFDGQGGEWSATLLRVGRDRASARLLAWHDLERESPLTVTLALGISSGERMDFAIQKATELGVNVVRPIATLRSVVRLKEERAERRIAHWRGVAIAACEQCGRNRVPVIEPVLPLLDFVALPAAGARILLSPEADKSMQDLTPATTVTLLIGAEGGLTPEERADALHYGYVAIRFGPRVLRSETAPLAVLAAIQAAWGDCAG